MIKVQQEGFNVDQLYRELSANSKTGAVAMFVGLVRDFRNSDNLSEEDCAFELEHYPGMTEANMQKIVSEASNRWDLIDVQVIHRVGKLHINDQIVFVGVAAGHRAEAFQACDFIMDYLKSRAAFWKKETQGSEAKWVEAKCSDEQSLDRWQK